MNIDSLRVSARSFGLVVIRERMTTLRSG